MHEVALAEGVMRIVAEAAARHDATRVHTVWVELGALAHVEPDALRFCFDAVTRGSVAEGAALEIATKPGSAWCLPCGGQVPLARLGDACPLCGSYQLSVIAGEEMRVKEIGIA
ncbi:MAG: hydrogenase maturation nickel metallochaperone HypA [Betaproteobacteria bacterium]|nr:hydrogenase maturation nickel metallochaperone HypA [Betaproteobacteria bacterium]MCC7215312.1 hydrogenase maturation nickel metallochaperone HypA [Burkholderiales bacterium]